MNTPVWFITGASRGFGSEFARTALAHGCCVVATARKPEAVTAALGEHENLLPVALDVTKQDQIDSAVKTALDTFGRIDVLVNNAGINRDKLMIGMREKDFDDVVNTNLIGTFRVTQPLFKRMLKRRTGVIINMASVVGKHGNIGQANYAASKAGVIGFTKAVAQEGALRGVRCNAIAPGMIASSMTAAIDEKRQKEIKERIPLKRLGTAEEVAQTALFLAQNDYLTGEVINVDGGMAM